jgi:hypothetical protein
LNFGCFSFFAIATIVARDSENDSLYNLGIHVPIKSFEQNRFPHMGLAGFAGGSILRRSITHKYSSRMDISKIISKQDIVALITLLAFLFGLSALTPSAMGKGGGSIGLQISNDQVMFIGDSTALIQWSTSIPAVGTVCFAPTHGRNFIYNNCYTGSALSPSGIASDATTLHFRPLVGLQPGTKYYYVIKSDVYPDFEKSTHVSSFTTLTGKGVDVTAPLIPTGLNARSISPAQVKLVWNISLDDDGVAGYRIYRDGIPLEGSSVSTGYIDFTVVPLSTYQYTVAAFDVAGNVSAQSAPLSVTIPIQ